MPTVAEALAANQAAVQAYLADVDQLGATWTTPRAPGKWTPAQVTEHVARTFAESVKVFGGQPAAFPALPGPLRFVARTLLFNRVVKNGTFPKAKTNKAMDPLTGPATPAEGRRRLEGAVAAFEQSARATTGASGDARLASKTFGEVSLSDWVRFQEIHCRHHQKQLRA